MLKVRFELHYDFDGAKPTEERCCCKVKIFLPADAVEKKLHYLLRDESVRVGEWRLSEKWGTGVDETLRMRVGELELRAGNWEELEEKVNNLIDESVKRLREVKERILGLERSTPKPRVVEIEI